MLMGHRFLNIIICVINIVIFIIIKNTNIINIIICVINIIIYMLLLVYLKSLKRKYYF